MHEENSHNREILEAMEACRSGHDDHLQPDMARLAADLAANPARADWFSRMQSLDVRLAQALGNLPVPEGLSARVLEKLATARGPAKPVAEVVIGAPPASKQVSRRWLVIATAALSTAAALLIATWLGWSETRKLTPSLVLEEVTEVFRAESAATGQLFTKVAPPDDYPLSRDIVYSPAIRWRTVEEVLDGTAVVYDLPLAGGGRAALFVARRQIAGLPTQPPASPALTTGGYSTGAWQDEDLVYVLVVEGDARTYQGLLRLSTGPLT